MLRKYRLADRALTRGEQDWRVHRKPMSVAFRSSLAVVMTLSTAAPTRRASPAPTEGAIRTKVVLLGTGTPVPDPDRSGPATAVVVDDRAYLIDFGPGVVRRAEAAALR